MNINKAFYKEIQEELNTSFLSTDDFKIDVSGSSYLQVIITYLYNNDYFFSFKINSEGIKFTRSPGNLMRTETGEPNGKEKLMSYMRGWLGNIENEIIAAPGLRELVDHKDEIDKKLSDLEEMFQGIGNGAFSKDEVVDVNEKLETLRAEFTKRLEDEIEDRAKLQNELRTMNKEIEFLKSQVQSLTKENWAKALFVKVIGWRKRNPKAVAAIATLTRELLPDGIKEHIPEVIVDVLAGNGGSESS